MSVRVVEKKKKKKATPSWIKLLLAQLGRLNLYLFFVKERLKLYHLYNTTRCINKLILIIFDTLNKTYVREKQS